LGFVVGLNGNGQFCGLGLSVGRTDAGTDERVCATKAKQVREMRQGGYRALVGIQTRDGRRMQLTAGEASLYGRKIVA
jgi:hypothetical protein